MFPNEQIGLFVSVQNMLKYFSYIGNISGKF